MELQDQVLRFALASTITRQRIKDLLVARLFKPFIGCDLLLSETMFSKTDTITYRRNKRELIIAFDKIERPFICTAKSRNMETMGVSVWTQ